MAFGDRVLPSVAVFSPQSKAPKEAYLDGVRSYLCAKTELRPLVEAIRNLPSTWTIFAHYDPNIAALSQGLRYTQVLSSWIEDGGSSTVADAKSGILSLPLLTIIQVVQYFQFLQVKRLRHDDFMTRLRYRGGIQGYCGGLLPATAIACSSSEAEVAINASKAVGIALGIGAYGELGDDDSIEGPTTIVVRLKYEGQGGHIIKDFPDAHISAITDPKTISIVGTAKSLLEIQAQVRALGMQTQAMHLRGKVHNPENSDLAQQLYNLCIQRENFQLSPAENLKAPLRSNRSGEKIREGSLVYEVIVTILASCCEWYTLLKGVCTDLERTESQSHLFAIFGIGDCVPLAPFHQAGLQITKLDILTFIKDSLSPIRPSSGLESHFAYPPNAVAVVGMACRLPGANNIEELWNLLSNGNSTLTEVPQDRVNVGQSFRALQDQKWAEKQKWWGNFISDIACFDHSFFHISPREAASMDPQQRILLETAYQAMESSGYLASHCREAGDPVGVFLGASFVEYLDNTSANPPTAYTSTGTIRAFLTGKISYHFGWTGPSEVLDTACSSSLVAINRACKAIQNRECPIALCGGVNLIAGIHNYLDLAKAGFLSSTGQCKPFDSAADGYCRSEGVGLIVLKSLSQALADSDQILGVMAGSGTNQGGLSHSLTIPHSAAQVQLYRDILSQAELTPEQVSYCEAHGTGTQAGDSLEVASIREVFGSPDRRNSLQLGSIKGNIGHCETAAGVAGVLKALIMIQKVATPPLASHKSLNPKIPALESEGLAISTSLKPWKASPRAALVNSYGAAGSNAAVLLCQAPDTNELSLGALPLDSAYPIIVSAASTVSLTANARSLASFLESSAPSSRLADVAFTLSEKRKRHPFLCVFVESSIGGLIKSLRSMPISPEAPKPRTVILTFSGQSRQSVKLNKDLYHAFPNFRRHLEACNEVLQQSDLTPCLPAVFDVEPIEDIVALHCGMFAVQYSCAMAWIDCGLQVKAAIGHSLGELTALAVSGVLHLEDAIKLVALRARLIHLKWGPDKGIMLSVNAATEVVQTLIAGSQDVEFACHNAPKSHVIVGTESAIANIEDVLTQDPDYRGIQCQRLSVTHGFHSRFTEPLLPDLLEVADSMVFKEPKIHLECCTMEAIHQVGPERVVQHTREPVFFYHAVRRLEQRFGSCLWLEAGLDSPVISMVKRAVGNPERHHFQDVKIPNGKNPFSLMSTITIKLWQEGVSYSCWAFRPSQASDFKQTWLPPYQFEKNHHWMPYNDHALDMSKNQPVNDELNNAIEITKSRRLVEYRAKPNEEEAFTMNTECRRYIDIVSGHAVLNKALCPAAMYMECAVMAAQLSLGETESQALWFESLTFEAPLGVDHGRDARIVLQRADSNRAWSFIAKSTRKVDPELKPTLHAKGKFGFASSTHLDQYGRLVAGRIEYIKGQSETEKLKSKRAYELFSPIVCYAELLKGISSIILSEWEALATIEVPQHSNASDSSAVGSCDTLSLDTFIQVAGLLINSSERCAEDQVFVATGVESLSMTSTCKFDRLRSWTVFAMFSPSSESKATGDVFVLSKDGALAMTIMGIQFTKLPISILAKLLDSANPKDPDVRTVRQSLNGSSNHTSECSSQRRSRTESDLDGLQSHSSNTSLGSKSGVPESADAVRKLKSLLASYVSMEEDAISDEAVIADLGVDSLAATELADDISNTFSREIDGVELLLLTFGKLCQHIAPEQAGRCLNAAIEVLSPGPNEGVIAPHQPPLRSADTKDLSTPTDVLLETNHFSSDTTILKTNPLQVLQDCDYMIEASAGEQGFTDYWTLVAPKQNELVLTYIGEEFRKIGLDLWMATPGAILPNVQYLPKHEKIVQRLWDILAGHDIVYYHDTEKIRSSSPLPTVASTDILNQVNRIFPRYASENRLMSITAPHFADGLTGRINHIDLLFNTESGRECLDDFYHNSPQLATMTSHLLNFFSRVLAESPPEGTLRILEVGAGFGGTTKRLAEQLENLGRPVQYFFTDISSMLVKEARKNFSSYTWMDFQVLNLEREPPASLRGSFDIVLGVNVVHATSNIVNSAKSIRSLLRQGGFAVLSEVTRIVDWYDLVYGLLDGWWAFRDCRTYPLQSADKWVRDLKQAGFEAVSYSQGATEESTTQQLIIGSTRPSELATGPSNRKARRRLGYRIETMPYKIVDELEILADVFLPECPTTTLGVVGMPLGEALMIHGGGYMTLSRRATRPHQTQFLLEKGYLPVSVDYRLCPEIDMISGPMTDVRDALDWVRRKLPAIAQERGVTVDPTRIVVVGWSTGGHLAMTTAWTCEEVGQVPPNAILSFYSPTNFESKDIDNRRAEHLPERTMSIDQIRKSLSPTPITSYDSATGADSANLGWLRPGDPRSELVLSLFKEGHGLRLMLNGFSSAGMDSPPPLAKIKYVSPTAQLEAGKYKVPTFIIHGDQDEIAPFGDSEAFVEKLKASGVKGGLSRVKGEGHIHDLELRPGVEGWDNGVGVGYAFLFEIASGVEINERRSKSSE